LAGCANGLTVLDPEFPCADPFAAVVALKALGMPLGAQRDHGSTIDWLLTACAAGRKQFPEVRLAEQVSVDFKEARRDQRLAAAHAPETLFVPLALRSSHAAL